MIAAIRDIKELLDRGRHDPDTAWPELKRLATSDEWQTREVAATAMVEIAKRHPAAVLATARRWARDRDANVRRAASEGLRKLGSSRPRDVALVLKR